MTVDSSQADQAKRYRILKLALLRILGLSERSLDAVPDSRIVEMLASRVLMPPEQPAEQSEQPAGESV